MMSDSEIVRLQYNVKNNPYDVSNHNKLIERLKLDRDLYIQELVTARYDKLNYFTYSIKEIAEWLDDLNSIEDEDIRVPLILGFYKKIIAEYPVVEYWSKYIMYCWELYKESDDFIDEDELRNIFLRALNDVVYDYKGYRTVWGIVLSFFTQIYEKSKSEEDFQVLLKLQLKCISYPHAELSESFSQFSKFVSKYAKDDYEQHMVIASKVYSKTQKQQKYYDEFEISLIKNPGDSFTWSEYIHAVGKYSSDTTQLSTIFHRSLMLMKNKEMWISVWLKFIYTLYSRSDSSHILEAVLFKFIRTYPENPISYAEYIRNCLIFEDGYEKFKDLRKRINQVDLMNTSNYDRWKILALSLLSFEFQLLKSQENNELEKNLLEDIHGFVNFAIDHNNDIFHSVEKMSISILEELKKIALARQIIEKMVVRFNDQCEVWLYNYNFEIKQNSSYSEISALLKRAVDNFKNLDWPERIIQEWLYYEQIYGTLDSYKNSLVQSDAKVKLLEIERMKESESEETHQVSTEAISEPKDTIKKPNEPVRNRERHTIRVSNLDKSIDQNTIKNFFIDCGVPLDIHSIEENNELVYFIEFQSEKEIFASLTKDKHKLGDRRINVERSLSSIVWVNNYPPSFTETDISNLFQEIGGMVNLRFPSQKSKKGRRFCYIEFSNSELSRKAVLALNGKELTDKLSNKTYRLTVNISNPLVSKNHKGSTNNEIIAKNLNFKLTDANKIEKVFLQFGEIENITVPLSDANKLKGFVNNGYAFITFRNTESVQNVLKKESLMLDERKLNIQKVDGHKDNHILPHEFEDLKTISVLNLGELTTNEQLKYFFTEKVGPVNKVEVYHRYELALVEFSSASDSGKASLLLANAEFNGEKIEISLKDKLLQLMKGLPSNSAPQKRALMVPTQVKRRKTSR